MHRPLALGRRLLVSFALSAPLACTAPESGADAGPGVTPDARAVDALPRVADAMPDAFDVIRDAMPDAFDAMPGAFDAMPDAFDAIPDAFDAIPDALDAMPPDAAADMTPDAPPPLDPTREHVCDDGLDDDGDGRVDCFDGDCLDDDPCRGPPMTPVQRVQDLFLQRCGCHTGALDLGGLVLVRPFTDTTVGVPAVLDPGRTLIVPGDVQQSFLHLKLTADIPPGLGERMPPEIPYLDAQQMALLEDWIAGLAPR